MSFDIFIPAVRRGLAALTPGSEGSERAPVDVVLRAKGHTSSGVDEEEIAKAAELYGPADVVGFDPRAVARTDPSPNSGDFEPNYFPLVEFADEDFAWRMVGTPAEESGQRKPWIALVVLRLASNGEVAEFDEIKPKKDGDRAPSIVVSTEYLPDLEHAWRWAHVHVSADKNLTQDEVTKLLGEHPEQAVCRLLCARRLKPRSRYRAFVVPTFKSGVNAALPSTPAPAAAYELAWVKKDGEAQEVTIPYFYSWEFGTSERGDFEYLLRLLEGRDLNAIQGFGVRPIDCTKPGFGITHVGANGAEESLQLNLEGALCPLDKENKKPWTPWGLDAVEPEQEKTKRYQEAVANLISTPEPKGFEFVSADTEIVTNLKCELVAKRLRVRVSWQVAEGKSSSGFSYSSADGAQRLGEVPRRLEGNRYEVTLGKLRPGLEYEFQISGPGEEHQAEGRFTVPELPRVLAPIYGRWHAAVSGVPAKDESSDAWIGHLNLDPRHRVAAGIGAEVIRKNQEALMASAWDQLGAAEAANTLLRHAQLGREVAERLKGRLERLSPESFLGVTRNVQKRTLFADGGEPQTFAKHLLSSGSVHPATLGRAFRRVQRPGSPLRKRLSKEKAVKADEVVSKVALGKLAPCVAAEKLAPHGTTSFGAIGQRIVRGSAAAPDAERMSEGRLVGLAEQAANGEVGWVEELGPVKPAVSEQVAFGALKALGLQQAKAAAPRPDEAYFPDVRRKLLDALRPDVSIAARLRRRFPQALKPYLGRAGVSSDALDPILWAPEFPQPMYEPLRDMGHELLLPGVEKIPQNTIGLLQPNRRFLEAYLLGCNHEFASELLWRGYPTDQRGSYFRQFWDVSGYVPTDAQVDANEDLRPEVREALRDVRKLHAWKEKKGSEWKQSQLTKNFTKAVEGIDGGKDQLVLVIRGDLLRRYPGALIYAVPGVLNDDDELVPALAEYGVEAMPPEFPLFQAILPPDITFFGFGFTDAEARGPEDAPGGKFFVIEERPGEARFGLDEPQAGAAAAEAVSDLSWADFGLGGQDSVGKFLDDAPAAPVPGGGSDGLQHWTDEASSAVRAWFTLQQPMRVAKHAKDLLPKPTTGQ